MTLALGCLLVPAGRTSYADHIFPDQIIEVGEAPNFVTAGDFNGDGLADLAIANLSGGEPGFLLGSGLAQVGSGLIKVLVMRR